MHLKKHGMNYIQTVLVVFIYAIATTTTTIPLFYGLGENQTLSSVRTGD